MNTIYQVVHQYDVDGGFGDAIPRVDVLEVFESKKNAEKFVEKFGNPHMYDKPYHELWCGNLFIKEIEVVPEQEIDEWLESYNKEDMWWLDNNGWVYEYSWEREEPDDEEFEFMEIDDEDDEGTDPGEESDFDEELVSAEIKKGEAVKRMDALGLMPKIVAEFERSGIIYYSEQEPFGGILYWLDNEPEWESAVREFEEEYNALVYHVIHTYTEFGELLNLLFVSDDDEEWEYDNDDILEGCAMSYVINLDVPEFSEFGTIGVEEAAGGLIRVA